MYALFISVSEVSALKAHGKWYENMNLSASAVGVSTGYVTIGGACGLLCSSVLTVGGVEDLRI